MKVRKYTARSSRDALRQVREDLGPDAVILANRMVRGGVELLAMPAAEMAAHTAASEARSAILREAEQPLEVTEDDVIDSPIAAPRERRKPWAALGFEPEAADPLFAPQRPGERRIERLREPAFGSLDAAVERFAGFAGADPLFDTSEAPGFTPLVAPQLPSRSQPQVQTRIQTPTQAPLPAHRTAQSEPPIQSPAGRPGSGAGLLGLKPEPAPLAPPAPVVPASRLNLKPAPPALEPAVLRRRPAPARPARGAPAVAAQVATHTAEPAPMPSAQLAAMAASHDPLMAALAAEVQSLGSMLGQGSPVAATSEMPAAPASPAGRSPIHAVEAVETRPRGPGGEEWVRNVMGELRSMRVLIEDQMGAMGFADGSRPAGAKTRMVRVLSRAGFSPSLIRRLCARLPDGLDEDAALRFVRDALANNLSVAGSEAALLDEGGVFALVGPTGAGKTTTAAKLAARFVVRHGAENMALLTTDGYRIGGQEQLRIYGRILGVAVHAVKDAEDLRRTLGELRNRKLVLIDTVGLSQRDRLVGEQHQMFAGCGVPVQRLLLLNATCHGDTLSDVVRAYRGDGLAGCIVTKLDEAAAAGAAIDTIIRERLRVFYAADGQRVPEDLHLAVADRLVDLALQQRLEAAESETDFPLELPPVHMIGAIGQGGAGSGVPHG